MWIHSIRLRNFKSYDNVQFTFPEPKDGRNIILIGAQNGHGKTTLLEAVYLCLYDKDAVTHLQRAGLNSGENGYSNFLQSALHHQAASRFGQYLMELEIEIRQNRPHGQCGLRIRRKWHFDHYHKPTGEQETHIEISKDGCYEPVDEEHIGKYLNSYALPIDYAPFFFFDGEKIVQTAQQSGTGIWLNTALKGLLGITLLDKLRESLKSYRNKCISENASQKMQDDLEKAERALQTAQAALDVFQTEPPNAGKSAYRSATASPASSAAAPTSAPRKTSSPCAKNSKKKPPDLKKKSKPPSKPCRWPSCPEAV